MASANLMIVAAEESFRRWMEGRKDACPYGEKCTQAAGGKDAEAYRALRDGLMGDDAGAWLCLFYISQNAAVRKAEIARKIGVRPHLVAKWFARAMEIAPRIKKTISLALAESNARGLVRRKKDNDLRLPLESENVEEID